MAGKIFINYRRDDSGASAGRLHDRLAQTFGRKNLFMDVDHIPAGVDFVDYLPSQVAACDVFLAVIGPNWLDAKDDDGRRRLENPDDFVTIEIGAALARNIRVIPVLVDGATTPKADKLPDSIKPLVRRNAVEVRNKNFGRDANALVDKVREALKSPRPGMGLSSFMASTAAWLMVPGRRRMVAGCATALLLLLVGWIGLYQMGVPVRLPWTPRPEQPHPPLAEAKAAADAEAQRRPEEAERQRLAVVKAETERKAKAETQAAAPAGGLFTIKSNTEAFGNNYAGDPYYSTSIPSVGACEETCARVPNCRIFAYRRREGICFRYSGADFRPNENFDSGIRIASEAEQQRLREEEQRQAKAATDAEQQRKTAEVEQQRLAARNAVQSDATQPSSTGLFTIRTNIAIDGLSSENAPKSSVSINQCEQSCARSERCKVFNYNKASRVCFTYKQEFDTQFPSFIRDLNFDSGMRK
jgi:hypothetical protein